MLSSMTGFGSKTVKIKKGGGICVELKSSNHKFLEVALHLPDGFLSLEDGIRKEIESRLKRGRVVGIVNLTAGSSKRVFVDRQLLRGYNEALKKVRVELGLQENPRIDTLINLPGVLSLAEEGTTKEKIRPYLKKALSEALEALFRARVSEGRALGIHLQKETRLLQAQAGKIRIRFKQVIKEKVLRIDLAEERAAFLKNSDITEELERISYHAKNFLRKLSLGSPVGKELDFIAQEMQREANTIGAKSCDSLISGQVVQLKSLIEKIREQAQNIE